MKTHNVIFLLLFLLSFRSNSQSLRVMDVNGTDVTGDTVEVIYQPGQYHGWTEISVEVFPVNIGSNTLELGAKKIEFNHQADEYHAFCFAGTCLPDFTFISPFTDILQAGQTDSTFSGHFRFDDTLHTPSVSRVAYVFYNVNNPADSAIVYVHYNTLLQSGIEDYDQSNLFLSEAWPNPANDAVNFSYRVEQGGSNEHFDVLISAITGEHMRKEVLVQKDGTLLLDTKALTPGVYNCVVVSGAFSGKARKFIVVH